MSTIRSIVGATMITIEFTAAEIEALNNERYHHPHHVVRRRMEVLWLKAQGLEHKDIARLAAVSPNTMRSYLRMYQAGGIERLKELHFYQPQSELEAYAATLEAHFRGHPPATIKEAMNEIEGVVLAFFSVHFYMRRMIQSVHQHFAIVFCFSALYKKLQNHLFPVHPSACNKQFVAGNKILINKGTKKQKITKIFTHSKNKVLPLSCLCIKFSAFVSIKEHPEFNGVFSFIS